MSVDNVVIKEKKPKLLLRLFLMLLVMAVIAGVLIYIKFGIQLPALEAQNQTALPPANVTVAEARQGQWQKRLKAIGSLVASQGIDITSEVTGVVKTLNFESGQEIKENELLLSLNNEIELAALTTAQAQYTSANNQYQRSLKLKNKKFVTENDLDQQHWAANSAKSQVESAKAVLNKKNIHAPFSGKLGIRSIDLGDYVSPGTKLVTLQAVDTLYLDFTLPERNFKQLVTGQSIRFKVRSYPGQVFEGKVQAWDPNLDVNTRNANVRAVVKNSNRLLAPGMFAEIDVESTDVSTVMTVPETAIFYNIYGEAVYVLEADVLEIPQQGVSSETEIESTDLQTFVLAARQIKVLYRENGLAGVVEGLNQGDKVVTSGQLKLFPSLKVVITDDVPEPGEQTTESQNKIDNTSG